MRTATLRGFVLTATFAAASCFAHAQTAGQDMHTAGHDTKDAAVDTGHATKHVTKKAYHGTKHVAKRPATSPRTSPKIPATTPRSARKR